LTIYIVKLSRSAPDPCKIGADRRTTPNSLLAWCHADLARAPADLRRLETHPHPHPHPPQMAPSGTKSANGKVFERRVARICMPLTVERNSMSHTHRCATWHTHRVPCGTPIAHRYELDQYITRAIWHKTCAIWQCHMARLGGAIWHTGIGRGPPPGRARREGISKGMAIGNPTVCPPRATWCTL